MRHIKPANALKKLKDKKAKKKRQLRHTRNRITSRLGMPGQYVLDKLKWAINNNRCVILFRQSDSRRCVLFKDDTMNVVFFYNLYTDTILTVLDASSMKDNLIRGKYKNISTQQRKNILSVLKQSEEEGWTS